MAVKKGSFALLLCGAAFAASAGQVYKWIDSSGRIHYSDMPRPGWTRVDVKAAPGSVTLPAATDGTQAGDQVESPERAQLRAEECQKRSEQLDTYRKSTQIVERDSLGNEKTFSEDERLQLIEQTQRQVNELCRDQS